jgi:hypothetical protein
MKKFSFFAMLFLLGSYLLVAQNQPDRSQRIFTDPVKGIYTEMMSGRIPAPPGSAGTTTTGILGGTNWTATDAASIDQYVKVSNSNQKTAAGWGLNDQRLSLYGTTNIPIWEAPFTITAWDESVDMTEDGTKIANGYNNLVQVYTPASSTPSWSKTITQAVRAIQISNDGLKVYVAAVNQVTQDSTFVYCFTVGQNAPVWVKSYPGFFTALTINRPGTRVLVGEYGDGINNKLRVLNATNGNTLFEAPFNDQYPPAISNDGNYIVSGDFSGYVYLYEYSSTSSTYTQKWSYKVAGTNSWVCGMGISADGTTIAIGTMMFVGSGYDGELYVFNNYSPTPLWVYHNMGDMVQCVDLSSDGSIIAAAGWGPFSNSGPDFFLFRKQSDQPYFTINSPGSLFCLDLSPDGKLCAVGGKAVHARAFGMGGTLYNVNSDLGGGTLTGLAVKSGSTQQAGVRAEVLGLTDYYAYSDDSSHYTIKFIPAGTYTVRYSAVGYITQDISGVLITDGQTTTQDVTLLPTGDAPYSLTATQGAALTVDLAWQAPPSGTILGYNIYRKQLPFEFYPATPLGTTGPGQLTYSDNTALPLTHYYYTVTAQLPSSLQSPYSNDAVGWTATGFITNQISAYVGTTPTIDGVISPGEWSDAFQVDLSDFMGQYDGLPDPVGSVTGYFKVNAAKTELYCAVDNLNDPILNDHDEVAFYVDDNDDGTYPPTGTNTEGNYWAVHYAAGDIIKYRPIYSNGGVGTVDTLVNGQIKVSAASGHVVYEFVIPLGSDSIWKINFNAQNQSGIFIFVLDDPTTYNSWWPCTNPLIFSPGGYGTITFGAVDQVPPPPDSLQIHNPPLTPDITLNWLQPNIDDFDHFNVYWSTNGGTNYTVLDNTIGNEYFYTVASNGSYMFYVTTVDKAGHESGPSNIVQADVVIGINEHKGASEVSMIKLGPNPFSRELSIDLRTDRETTLTITVYDLTGKTVMTLANENVGSGLHHYTWNGRDMSGNTVQPGVYTIRFSTSGGQVKTSKVVYIK